MTKMGWILVVFFFFSFEQAKPLVLALIESERHVTFCLGRQMCWSDVCRVICHVILTCLVFSNQTVYGVDLGCAIRSSELKFELKFDRQSHVMSNWGLKST